MNAMKEKRREILEAPLPPTPIQHEQHQPKDSIIDIKELEKLMEFLGEYVDFNLEDIHVPVHQCCIYRVPKDLRKINEAAYTPQVISIGPLHHGEKEFIEMEKQKLRYMLEFSKRVGVGVEKLKEFKRFIEDNEQDIRNCYQEYSSLPSPKFVSMILHDAVFIIEEPGEIRDLPIATKLHRSGVKFKMGSEDSLEISCNDVKNAIRIPYLKSCELPIPWIKGLELQIPRFKIHDHTECLYRNMMALEQCHYPFEIHICNFIRLMDHLIDTVKDVDLLVDEGIIVNSLGDNAAIATMFNKLCLQIVHYGNPSKSYNISKKLKEHYGNRWNHTMATFKTVYFSDIWKGTATVAAAILLVLTFIQTVFSIVK
ncbi:hypothetical protein EZV62_000554 [Acer yangbiense]|uniref:Uncharacterized protein n=1 Tax=Acer yangbiense TaxID=1000413 RepID=A0A5C7IRY7_9ROSI|nr:hypothetical protein EZV62_000554 [Acer yangbiense]